MEFQNKSFHFEEIFAHCHRFTSSSSPLRIKKHFLTKNKRRNFFSALICLSRRLHRWPWRHFQRNSDGSVYFSAIFSSQWQSRLENIYKTLSFRNFIRQTSEQAELALIWECCVWAAINEIDKSTRGARVLFNKQEFLCVFFKLRVFLARLYNLINHLAIPARVITEQQSLSSSSSRRALPSPSRILRFIHE